MCQWLWLLLFASYVPADSAMAYVEHSWALNHAWSHIETMRSKHLATIWTIKWRYQGETKKKLVFYNRLQRETLSIDYDQRRESPFSPLSLYSFSFPILIRRNSFLFFTISSYFIYRSSHSISNILVRSTFLLLDVPLNKSVYIFESITLHHIHETNIKR